MKNNLRIYETLNKMKKKNKLQNMKLKRIALALSIVVMTSPMISSCKNNTDLENYNYENSEDYYYEYNETDENNYVNVKDEILNLNCSINDSNLTAFQTTISNIQVDYPNVDSYGITESLNAYNSLNSNENIKSREIIKNNKVDYNILYDVIEKNNKEYKENNENDNYYTKLNSNILSDVVEIIVDTINYNIQHNKTIDLNVLDYKLKNLKVFEFSDFGYAFYSQDDIALALNLGAIPDDSNDKISALEEIVIHETNHIMQDATFSKDPSVEQNLGVCYRFKNVDLNALYWVWYVEAAAQNNVLIQKNIDVSDSIIYDTNVSSLNTLNSTSVLIKNSTKELSYITAQSDINEFFKYFNCKTNEEKEEIINMMVAYNLVLDEYDNIYSAKFFDSNNISDEYNFKKELKASIGQTMTKIFYKNLAEKIKGISFRLEDVFSLISVFETELSKEIWYNSVENIPYMDDFYKNYQLIQTEFFELISRSLDINISDIEEYYVNYHNTVDQSNFNNSLFNSEQNNFYKEIYLNNNYNKTKTVIEVNKKIQNYSK